MVSIQALRKKVVPNFGFSWTPPKQKPILKSQCLECCQLAQSFLQECLQKGTRQTSNAFIIDKQNETNTFRWNIFKRNSYNSSLNPIYLYISGAINFRCHGRVRVYWGNHPPVMEKKTQTVLPNLSSWWLNQPIWKKCFVKLDHLPQFSGKKIKKLFELPPIRSYLVVLFFIKELNWVVNSFSFFSASALTMAKLSRSSWWAVCNSKCSTRILLSFNCMASGGARRKRGKMLVGHLGRSFRTKGHGVKCRLFSNVGTGKMSKWRLSNWLTTVHISHLYIMYISCIYIYTYIYMYIYIRLNAAHAVS